MDKKEFAVQLEKYLLELKETMPVCDQVHAWGYGAISFAWGIDAISAEDYKRILCEHNERFGKGDWND